MSRNNGMSAVDKCYVQLYLIERSCTIEGSRSQTREVTRWNLKIKAFLINARKIPGVKDTGLKKGRVPFSHVSPLLCAACIPHSSYTISFPSLLLPVISVISTTSPPFNLDSPQMPRLRFRIPFVARRHTWRMLAVTSRTCAELLRKEPARYNRSFCEVHRSRWDICILGRGILEKLARKVRADVRIAHVAWFYQILSFPRFIISH